MMHKSTYQLRNTMICWITNAIAKTTDMYRCTVLYRILPICIQYQAMIEKESHSNDFILCYNLQFQLINWVLRKDSILQSNQNFQFV